MPTSDPFGDPNLSIDPSANTQQAGTISTSVNTNTAANPGAVVDPMHDRAAPFLDLYKRIRNEFEGAAGETLTNGKVGAGFQAAKFEEDYDAKKDSLDSSALIDSHNVSWPDEDDRTVVAGHDYPWEKKDQYYFELVSFHQKTNTHNGVGTGERRWLNPNKILEAIDDSATSITSLTSSTPKNLITKKIEFLMQLLKMISLADKEGIENITSRHAWVAGSNPKRGFLDVPMDEGSLDDHTCGFYFTSPDRDGSFDDDKFHAGADSIVGQTPTARVDGDLDGHTSTGSRLNGSLIPNVKKDWPSTCDDDLRHLIRLNQEPDSTTTTYDAGSSDVSFTTLHAGYRWESWYAQVTFEGFLYYLAQLISYLDVAFYTEHRAFAHQQIDAGSRSVFMGGIKAILFPAGSRNSLSYPYLPQGGYSNLTLSDIDKMIEVVNSERVLIPNWLRDWWNGALTSTSERDLSSFDALDYVAGADAAAEATSATDPSAPSSAYEQMMAATAPDLEACAEEIPVDEGEACSSCSPNPNALVPNWTHPRTGPVFLNERDCLYSAIVVTNMEVPPANNEELEPFMEEGLELLLNRYKKQKLITVTYADGSEVSANTIDILMGRVPASTYLGSGAVDVELPMISDKHVSTTPIVPMKILVTVVAQLFDLIPVDLSEFREEETPVVSTYVQLKSKDVRMMIRQVSRSFKVYAKRYAAYIHEMNYDDQMISESFGDLDLDQEAENLKVFREDLSIILKHHGFRYTLAEFIKIGFKDDDGDPGWTPYQIEYIEVNEPGCAPILLDRATWSDIAGEAVWNNTRTLAYIAKLPDIWLEVTAMVFPEWNQIAAKYTYGLLNSEDLLENIPENALDCFLNDLVADPLNSIMNDIAGDVLSMPDAIANKFNKMLCEGDEYDRIDNWSEEIKGLYKRAYEASMAEAFAGDPVYDILDDYFKNRGSGDDVNGLWAYVLDKYGWCGILALIDMILGCLLKGVATEDGLAIIIRAALKSLGPLELEKLFIGLPADKQEEIAAAVAEATGQITATPPWEKGYNPGSYSFGPERTGLLQGTIMNNQGRKMTEDGIPLSDMTDKEAASYAYYISNLDPDKEEYKNFPEQNLLDPDELQSQLAEQFPEEYGDKQLESKSYSGVGTIGAAADDVMDAIFEAYTEAIFDLVEIDLLTDSLQQLPGGAFIGSILSTMKCAVPPLFSPPLDDFMKTLELDFCRGNYNLTLPKFNMPDIAWANILDAMMKAILETIQNLIIKVIFMLIKYILDLLLTGLCKLLGLIGDALEAALSDNFRETFRDALCGDESNPMSQLTDQEIDDSVAGMLAALSGCPTPSSEAAAALITDLSTMLLDAQLIDLLNGEASDEVLDMIANVVQYRHPEWVCALNNGASISDLFGSLGGLIPAEYKKLPRPEALPILPAYCADQAAVDEFYQKQCILMQRKGNLTEEMCNEILDGIQDRAKKDIENLADIAQNGLLGNLLPDIFADDPQCPGTWNAGIAPRNVESVTSAASVASKAVFDSIEQMSQRDMNNGKGVVNMILAAKNGKGFKGHYFNLTHFPIFTENKFPEQVAGHLKNMYADGFGESLDFDTISSTTTLTPPRWGADMEPTFMILEKGNGNFKAKCYPSNTDFNRSDSWLEKYDITDYGSTSVTFKTPDFSMEFADYRSDQQYSFEMDYSNFDIVNGRSVMNDYFRVLISHKANDKSDAEDPKELEWHEGFSGEQRTVDEVTEMVELASEGYRTINIDNTLDAKMSPKNSIYAELLRGSWDEPLEWIPESANVSSVPIDTEDDLFVHFYEYYDDVFKSLMARIADMSSDTEAFKHGMSTEYRGPEDEYVSGDAPSFEDMLDSIKAPTKVYLSGTYVDKEGVEWNLPPETYGGTTKYPAWYMQTPEYDGWMGIRQVLSPDEIYTGCEPEAKSLADFSTLSEIVDDLYNRLPDDPRLTESEHCAMEHPWNKILDRYSSAGIEASIRATVRIYVLEALIRGMPSFVNVQGKFPENYDEVLAAHIADTIDDGLMEQTQGRVFRDPLLYYLSFMEQVVQSFGKRIDLGDFEPTPAEQEAIDRLTGKSSTPNELNQDYWERNDYISIARQAWPGQIGAGIMAAVGSTLGPAGSIAGAIAGGGASVLAAKRRKEAIWKRYISHPENLRDAKILLRRYIKDEMEYVCEKFNKNYEPVIDNINSLFLVDGRFIIGALESGGPIDVPDVQMLDVYKPTVDKIHTYIESHPELVPSSAFTSWSPDLTQFWDPEDDKFWPFVFEKYVKITDKEGLFSATVFDTEEYDLNSHADWVIFKRGGDDQVYTGIMNFDTWNSWVQDNSAMLTGKKIEDLFEKWEVGVRISHLSQKDDGYPASWGGDNINEISMRAKAYQLYDSEAIGGHTVKYLLPIASVEREIDATGEVVTTANNLSSIFDGQLDCLVADLIEHPRYKLMFEYCFSLPRIMSLFTIYNMKAFLPSIGSAEADGWETKLLGSDKEAGGGKWGKRFRRWDWNDLFKRSKRQAKNVFEEYYNATDLGHQSDKKSDLRQRRIDLNINLDLNFDWLGFLMKRKRNAPFDEDGRPCPLVDEED